MSSKSLDRRELLIGGLAALPAGLAPLAAGARPAIEQATGVVANPDAPILHSVTWEEIGIEDTDEARHAFFTNELVGFLLAGNHLSRFIIRREVSPTHTQVMIQGLRLQSGSTSRW